MSGQANLERRYRRLLACYPRAFRRENEGEILAVLLACAQPGQQRPGPAASTDLIKGAIQAWLRPARGRPRNVRTAIRLMYAGLAAQLAALATIAVTAGSVRTAVAHRYPGLAVAQHLVNVQLIIDYAGALAGIVVWLALTWALVRGRGRARIALAADLGAMTLSMLIAIGQGSTVYAPADLIAGAVTWLITLAACVLLFTRASGRFYHPQAQVVTAWRGTFGTM
ncbi:MAG TPA: hypothetical protein VGM53_20995 [Streptosporangiaceae bacterium]|jgi:hypothetical protein